MPINNFDFARQYRKIAFYLIIAGGLAILAVGTQMSWERRHMRTAIVVQKENELSLSRKAKERISRGYDVVLRFKDDRNKDKECTVTLDAISWQKLIPGSKVYIFYDHKKPANQQIYKVQIGPNPFPAHYFFIVGGIVLAFWGLTLLKGDDDSLS